MEKGQNSQGDARRRRVQRLKKMIMLSVLIWMILPVGLCIVLFGRISALNSQIEETQDSQQQLLQQIAAAVAQQEQITATMAQQTPLLDRKEIVVSAPVAGADVQNGDMAVVEPEAAHKVYLTFDDGPSKYTEEILDILDDYDVKATFFEIGRAHV